MPKWTTLSLIARILGPLSKLNGIRPKLISSEFILESNGKRSRSISKSFSNRKKIEERELTKSLILLLNYEEFGRP